MSTEVETTEQRAVREAAQRLRWTVEEVKAMQTTERVLIGVEHSLLGCAPESYDTASINAAMRALNQAIHDADAMLIGEAQAHLMEELYAWRMDIFKRDEKLMAHSLRRFCERTDGALDIHAFAALARFYRRCPHVGLVQCKYDLAVTRLFTVAADHNSRALRTNRKDMAARLTEMCAMWDESIQEQMDSQSEKLVAQAVEEFDEFIDEVNAVTHFEDLIARDLFNRVRAFKSRLGELFFHPEVTAAAIECNVISGNKFSSLLEEESDQISDEPLVDGGLPEIFSDTSHGALSRMAQVLDELQADDRNEDEVTRKRLERIVRLLNIACEPDKAMDDEERSEQAVTESELADESEEERFTSPETLQELSAQADNKAFIESYLKPGRSPEVRALDLKIFLAPVAEEDGASTQARQLDPRPNALGLIMAADDMLRFELAAQGDALPSHLESRLAKLFGEMQASEGELREIMSAALGHNARKDALLYVSNHLLGARLRLQSAIVRRSASELARREAARAAAAAQLAPADTQPSKHKTKGSSPKRLRRLLAAAVIIIALASLAALLIRRTSGNEGLDKEVRVLNPSELPGSEMIASARIRRDTLVCIVRGMWKHLPEEARRQELESLSRYGKERGLNSVVLFNEQGMPAGSAEQGQITVEDNVSVVQ
jgi:hypothetical protein